MKNIFKPFFLKIWNNYTSDLGKILIHGSVLGYFLGTGAQLFALAKNDKLSRKEKQYLIPQELTDGIISIAGTLTLCTFVKNLGDKFLESGKNLSCELIDLFKLFAEKETPYKKLTFDLIDKINDLSKSRIQINKTNLNNPISFIIDNLKILADKKIKNLLLDKKTLIERIDDAAINFSKTKNGLRFWSTVGTGILLLNGILPPLKNYIASKFQKHLQNKDMEQNVKMLQYSAPMYAKKYNFTGLKTELKPTASTIKI